MPQKKTNTPRFNLEKSSMVQHLHAFCEINSGTTNLAGLAKMHDQLRNAFQPIADVIESINMPEYSSINMEGECILQKTGQGLLVKKRPNLKRRVLLAGHMDTVYSADDPFQTLKMLNENTLNGPGVTDMKGGLVVMLHALMAFEQTDAASQLGWDVFINADEETGSNTSHSLMLDIAQHCQAALLYEPAMSSDGIIAKNRKGNGKVTLTAKGISAHAGRDFISGRNAICFLAEVIIDINGLNGQREGVTLNVGIIAGGSSLNTVPDKAVTKIDVRITFPDDELWVIEQLNLIVKRHQKPDYALSIDIRFDRPVKRINPATERLFSLLQHIGSSMNMPINWKDSGGCCDGNNLAQHGLPILDTLGVRGGNIHTPNEFILLDSLIERASLSTQLLIQLAQGKLEDLGNIHVALA